MSAVEGVEQEGVAHAEAATAVRFAVVWVGHGVVWSCLWLWLCLWLGVWLLLAEGEGEAFVDVFLSFCKMLVYGFFWCWRGGMRVPASMESWMGLL